MPAYDRPASDIFTGQVVVVTGASQGIGKAICLELTRLRPRPNEARDASVHWRPKGSRLRIMLRFARLAGAILASLVLVGANAAAPPPAGPDGLTLVPEAERPYRRVVIGLDPLLASPYMLPEGSSFRGLGDPRLVYVRRQLYWLSFELSHGAIVDALPKRTKLFVAAPDPSFHSRALGDEREEFREYLKVRRKWSPAEIAERVRFFTVGRTLPYPRDIAEPIGNDEKGRLVLGVGAESDFFYREAVERLVKTFPADFALRLLPGVNTEGGDLELVRLPEGKLGLLLGHHRILRWLEYRHGEGVLGRAIRPDRIDEAKIAFRKAFFDLEVLVVNEEGLRTPTLVSDELFHSDMIVNVVRGSKGMVAFIPSYEAGAVDAVSREPLSLDVVRRAQTIYDRVARKLGDRGFRVARLPFADHPVRNPVNVGRYVEPTGEQVVLLGKYPYHFALPDGTVPQRELQKRFDEVGEELVSWKSSPSKAEWERVKRAFVAVWAEMDRVTKSDNPTFDRQAKAYLAEGVRVVSVPIYPTGEGGLHCLSLASLLDAGREGAGSRTAHVSMLPNGRTREPFVWDGQMP